MKTQSEKIPVGIRCIIWCALVVAALPARSASIEPTVNLTVANGTTTDKIVLPRFSLSTSDLEFIAENPTLRVAILGKQIPPHQTISEGIISSHSIEFLQSVAVAYGFQLDYKIFESSAALLDALKSLEADITPSDGIIDTQHSFLRYTSGLTPTSTGLIGRISDSTFEQNPQLAGKRVAVSSAYTAHGYFDSQFPAAIAVPVESPMTAVEMTANGDVDYYYGALANLLFDISSQPEKRLEIKKRTFSSTTRNPIAVRSDWPQLVTMFDRFAEIDRSDNDPFWVDDFVNEADNDVPSLDLTEDQQRYLATLSVLRVATVSGAPLLNDIDETGNHVGVAAEFTAYVARQMGIPVELKPYQTVEAMMQALALGEVDVSPYFAITDERKQTLEFSDPYLVMPWLVVGNIDSTLYWDLESLNGKTLALRKKHPLIPFLNKNYPEINILLTDLALDALEAVASENADATIDIKLYINRSITELFAGVLQVMGEVPGEKGAFAFAVDPSRSMLIPIINDSLTKLDPAFIDRVVRRWVAVDFEPARQLRKWLAVLVPGIAVLSAFLLALLFWNNRVRREYKSRLKAEQRLIDMTDRLHTGVFQFRQYGNQPLTMEFTNTVTRKMARVAEGEHDENHMSFFNYIDEEDRENVLAKLNKCLATGQHFRESFRFNYPNSEKGWILCDATCRQDSDGARVWSGYLFNLTSERLMSEQLNASLLARDEFMSMASHELRTPIQNVSMALESVNYEAIVSAEAAKVSMAAESAKDLEGLVNDILQLSSMNYHSPVLRAERTNLHKLLETLCAGFKSVAQQKQIALRLNIDNNVSEYVFADSLRLKQILYNVIGNAVKYTQAGHVLIDVSAESDTQSTCFVISDTGIGIPSSQLKRIFEPFSTVGPPTLRSSGLGLTLSQRLVAVMGGSITVKSTPGEGSLFTIALPFRSSAGAETSPEEDSVVPESRWHKQSEAILVVDDNLLVRETLSALLEASGWRVSQAESGADALEMVKDFAFRAVISDQRMPGMSGLELAVEIRSTHAENEPRPVLILMSGGMDSKDAARASALFDAMLFKPIQASSIGKAIDDVMNRHVKPTEFLA